MITSSLMTAELILNHVVESGRDSYNKPTYTRSSQTVRGYFDPRRTNTVVEGGDIRKTDVVVFVQPTVDLDGLESVTFNGTTYDIDGVPLPHWNPVRSRFEYVAIYLREGKA